MLKIMTIGGFCIIPAALLLKEGNADAYTWTQWCPSGTPSGSPPRCPTSDGQILTASPTQSLPTGSSPAIITIAPYYSSGSLETIYALSDTQKTGDTHDYLLYQYIPSLGWNIVQDNNDNDLYLRGVVIDASNGAMFGWNYAGAVYDNEAGGNPKNDFNGYTSVLAYNAASSSGILQMTNNSTTCSSDSPAGQ